jgi:hypothetical protein
VEAYSGIPESLGYRALSIVRNSKQPENTTFRKLDLFLTSDEGRETLCSVPQEELTSFTVMTKVKIQKPSDSGCYTPSSVPFRIY